MRTSCAIENNPRDGNKGGVQQSARIDHRMTLGPHAQGGPRDTGGRRTTVKPLAPDPQGALSLRLPQKQTLAPNDTV